MSGLSGMEATKQRDAERVYHQICAFMHDHDDPPSTEALAEWLGFRAHRVQRALLRLRAAGRVCERSTLPTVYINLPPAA